MAAGKNQTDAWIGAGYSPSSRVNASVNANEALKNPKIAKRISELRKTDDIKTAMATKHQKRSILLAMILDPLTKPADRIRAIEVDSKLAGHYAVEKVEVDTGPNLLASIEERAKRVGAVLSRSVGLLSRDPI